MESLNAGDLKIDIVEQDNALRLHWLGMSNERLRASMNKAPANE